MVAVTGSSARPVVKTFTSAGNLLGAFVWDRGRIVGMGWTNEEELMLVEESGEVQCSSCACMSTLPGRLASIDSPAPPQFPLSRRQQRVARAA
jgi:Vps16, N-terminal region